MGDRTIGYLACGDLAMVDLSDPTDPEPWLHDDGSRGPIRRGEYLPVGQLGSVYAPRTATACGSASNE